jgi:hypothetical protein
MVQMPRSPNENETSRISIRASAEVGAYLDELAVIGIHGKTRSEVAKTLLGNEVERLIRDGLLGVRRGADPK